MERASHVFSGVSASPAQGGTWTVCEVRVFPGFWRCIAVAAESASNMSGVWVSWGSEGFWKWLNGASILRHVGHVTVSVVEGRSGGKWL